MPDILGANPDPALSPSAAPADQNPDVNSAAPSTAQDAAQTVPSDTSSAEPKTMEEAIAAAFESPGYQAATEASVKPSDADPKSATDTDPDADLSAKPDADDKDGPEKAATDPSGEEPGSTEAKEATDPTDGELAEMKPAIRKRIQTLLGQRAAARQEAEGFRGDADSYRTIRQYMSDNRLQDEEAAELFKLGADLKSGDPVRLKAFIDRVMPRLQFAREAIGEALSTDLSGQVDAGEMTEAAARELSQARHARAIAEARTQEAQAQVQTQNNLGRHTQVQAAVATWHQQTRTADPDFDLKLDAMKLAAQVIVSKRGLPPTPELAVAYAKEAYAEATAMVRKLQPRPAATRPTPTQDTTSASRTGARPAPTSIEDAVKQAFERAPR